ncbi:DUF4911 domain-containing protein [Natroniella acetigena]|nr:DUF4911 domain-containing protein [Natroniella acetigena]MCK8828401.1 DUF4911 domain-containing protein [Natroniella acetigena]
MEVKIVKKELAFVDKILKAYEGLAMVTVVGTEGEIGRLKLEFTEGTKDDLLKILNDLQNKVSLEIIEEE